MSDSVTGVLEWDRGSSSPRPVVRGGLSVSSRLSETLGYVSPAGVEVRAELRAHGNPPSSLLFINVKLGDVSLLDVALCIPTENIGGSDCIARRVGDVQIIRAGGRIWPKRESAGLVSALVGLTQLGTTEDGGVIVGPQGWELTQAELARAVGVKLPSTTAPVRARVGVEGEVLPAPAADPPMAYGYRRFASPAWDDPCYVASGTTVAGYQPIYALRWGASGRITGIDGPFGEPGGLRPVVPLGDGRPADPALFEYDTDESRLAWARSVRWDDRLGLGGES